MATDRGCVLTIRAALRGIIDFRAARILDVNWWRRSNILLQALVDEEDARILETLYRFQCALIANGGLTEESFTQSQRHTKETCNELINAIQPWAAKSAGSVRQKHIQELIALYKEVVGDPDDPVFKAKMEAEAAAMLAEARRAVPESDEDRIERLSLERDSRELERLRQTQDKL